MENYYVSETAKIGKNVKIGKGAIIYDNVEIGDNCFIGPYVIIGEPTIDFYKNPNHQNKKTTIGANSIIRAHTVIYEDVKLGEFFQSGHYTMIRENTVFGHHCSFGSCSELPGKVKVGNYVRIHSKVILCENIDVKDYVWIFPYAVITNAKHPPVSELSTTIINEYAQILTHATILPGINIGKNAIVGAGALVTKDVADERLVIGNPAKDVKSVLDIKDEAGTYVYPWKKR
jgi:acetyltransferase-like isoleucine patch superfamily enzyme